MSVNTDVRRKTADQIREADADNAAGVTVPFARPGKGFNLNHPGAAPPAVDGVSSAIEAGEDAIPESAARACPDPAILKAWPEADLATAINTGHHGIRAAAHCAKQHAADALTGALRTGTLLVEVHRRQGKSGWGVWLKAHCPDLPVSTAYRYRDLARKFPHVRNSGEIPNLRQAYVAVGILPDKPAEKKKKAPDLNSVPPPTGTDVVAQLQSNRAFLDAEFERVDPATLDDAERGALLAEIDGLIVRLSEIRNSIARAGNAVNEDAMAAAGKEVA